MQFLVSGETKLPNPIVGNFHQSEVVGRGSETQLQMGKNYSSSLQKTSVL